MTTRLERVKQSLDNLRQALEELESTLLEFEEALEGEGTVRPEERKGIDLLSIPEVCQELGMVKSWVYRALKSGEIPSIKLGRNIKVKRADLEGYLESMRYRPSENVPLPGEE
jgi:excisionase family DNA binding protein